MFFARYAKIMTFRSLASLVLSAICVSFSFPALKADAEADVCHILHVKRNFFNRVKGVKTKRIERLEPGEASIFDDARLICEDSEILDLAFINISKGTAKRLSDVRSALERLDFRPGNTVKGFNFHLSSNFLLPSGAVRRDYFSYVCMPLANEIFDSQLGQLNICDDTEVAIFFEARPFRGKEDGSCNLIALFKSEQYFVQALSNPIENSCAELGPYTLLTYAADMLNIFSYLGKNYDK